MINTIKRISAFNSDFRIMLTSTQSNVNNPALRFLPRIFVIDSFASSRSKKIEQVGLKSYWIKT